jgi:hypothetical protein
MRIDRRTLEYSRRIGLVERVRRVYVVQVRLMVDDDRRAFERVVLATPTKVPKAYVMVSNGII